MLAALSAWLAGILDIDLLRTYGWRLIEGLKVTLPADRPCDYAYVLKITGLRGI